MVTSHTEALNELYGPPDHFCVSHTHDPTQSQAQKQRPFTGSQIHGENTDGGSRRKKKQSTKKTACRVSDVCGRRGDSYKYGSRAERLMFEAI